MATTSDHSCPSSSPTKYSADPAGQVEELLAQAQIAVELDPRVERFVVENCNDFFTAFMRQVNLIKSRSQAFEDCHVTVFDKVLLELTQNGNNLKNAPAVRYFCEEFLGIPSNASGVQKTAMLAGAINASSLEDPDVSIPNNSGNPKFASDFSDESVDEQPELELVNDIGSLDLSSLARHAGPAMDRMWSVYMQAKRDFYADTAHDDKKQRDVAKFLRDTTENILQYVKGKHTDQLLLDELVRTFQTAEEAVSMHHGGKKRKFDDEHIKGSRTACRNPASRIESDRHSRRSDCRRGVIRERTQADFPGHTQALIHRSKSQHSDRVRRNAVAELFPDDQRFVPGPMRNGRRRGSPRQPGRGHSGIPFGYTRAVDSYQPGK